MLTSLLALVLKAIWPAAPTWVGELLGTALPAIVTLVEELNDLNDRPKRERFAFVVREVGELLDDAFDDVPEWAALEEKRRDRIIGGLVELAVFVDSVSGKKGLRKARRKLRKADLTAS